MGHEFDLSFGFQSNPGRDGQDGTARLINAFAESAGAEGKARYPLYAIEGLVRLFSESTSTGVRGMHVMDGKLYVVAGQSVYEVDAGGNTTLLGGMPGTDAVYMARNANATAAQMALVSEGTVKVIQSGALSNLEDPDLPPPNSVTEIAGYLVFSIPGGKYYITAANDITVDALDFASAEQSPDGLKRAEAHNGYLWLFGEKTTEIHANTGNADFPFQILAGGTIPYGTLAAASVATLGQRITWLDQDGVVRTGNGAQRISHHAVERSVKAETDKPGISGTAYSVNGHDYYSLSGSTFTWAYDFTTGLWHERQSHGLARWRGEHAVKFGNDYYVGDYNAGKVYRVDPDTYDEDGNAIVMDIRSPIVHAGQKKLSHSRLKLDVVTGVGLNTSNSNNSDPLIELSYSDNGGKKWATWKQRSLGKIGNAAKTVKFHRLGQSSEAGRTYRVRCSADVLRGLNGARLMVR